MAEPAKVIDRGALYYPNVHIRDTEWLKATLLCFPSLDRMVPGDYPVADADVPKFFAGQEGRNGRRMLGIRKIDDHETHEERLVLLNRIKEDVEKRDLAARFSESATRREFGEKGRCLSDSRVQDQRSLSRVPHRRHFGVEALHAFEQN